MASASSAAAGLESKDVWGDAGAGAGGAAADDVEAELAAMTTDELRQRVSMLANQIRASKSELNRLEDEIKCVAAGRAGRAVGAIGIRSTC